MDITGQAIKHKSFGSGIVTAVTDGTITVCFAAGEKKFIYPDAFNNFLVLKDKESQAAISLMIESRGEKEKERRFQEEKKLDLKRKLLNFTISANSQAVFNIPMEEVSQVRTMWSVSTGCYLSGYSKGMPRIPDRLKPNSACLLTVREKELPESKRKIIGAFMVKEDFFGNECHTGVIESHSRHRIIVPENTSLLFWKYFGENAQPRWGNTAIKYFSNQVMNQILFDITQANANTEASEKAADFYEYFCKMNKLHAMNGM